MDNVVGGEKNRKELFCSFYANIRKYCAFKTTYFFTRLHLIAFSLVLFIIFCFVLFCYFTVILFRFTVFWKQWCEIIYIFVQIVGETKRKPKQCHHRYCNFNGWHAESECATSGSIFLQWNIKVPPHYSRNNLLPSFLPTWVYIYDNASPKRRFMF